MQCREDAISRRCELQEVQAWRPSSCKPGSGIYGSAGRLGYFPDSHADKTLSDPGKDGGVALTIRHEGQENRTWIYNEGGELFGGGGGGEQGQQGAWPVQAGTCDRGYSTYCSSGYYFGGYD